VREEIFRNLQLNKLLVNKSKMRLSVILPIYNGMPYLVDALSSLLNQSYQDFIVYAIDNGSTDGTNEYITELKNEKIIYIRLEEKDLVKALNKGLELSNTPLIARMDADDISHPLRFEKQINFLDENCEIDLVGSNGQYISALGDKHLDINLPLNHDKIIQTMMKKKNAIIHASIMFRNEIIELYGNYDNKYFPCEDYELFLRMGDKIKFANIPDRLYQFRVRENSIMTHRINESTKLYYYIAYKYSSKYKNNASANIQTNNFYLNLLGKLDIISVRIYRKGLNYYLNRSVIIGLFYFLIASIINPIRFISAIKRKLSY